MKTFASPTFFRTFDLLLAAGNPGQKLWRWTRDGVEWERQRHSYSGLSHGFAVEIATLTRTGRQGWTLLVVREFWWLDSQAKEIRSSRWAQLLSGRRNDALGWMRAQEKELESEMSRVETDAVTRR